MSKTIISIIVTGLVLLAAGRTDEHRDTRRIRPAATPTVTVAAPALVATETPWHPIITDVTPGVCHTCPSYEPTPPGGPTPIVGGPCADNPSLFCPDTPHP